MPKLWPALFVGAVLALSQQAQAGDLAEGERFEMTPPYVIGCYNENTLQTLVNIAKKDIRAAFQKYRTEAERGECIDPDKIFFVILHKQLFQFTFFWFGKRTLYVLEAETADPQALGPRPIYIVLEKGLPPTLPVTPAR